MNRKNLWWIIGALVLIAAIVAGIVLMQEPALQEEEVVQVGAVLPLTGPAALPGSLVRNGLELGVEEINNEEDGIRLKLLLEDSKNEPREGIAAFNRLSSVEHIDVAVSALSSVSLTILPAAENDSIPLMVTLVTYPDVAQRSSWLFRHFINNADEAKLMANYLMDEIGLTNIGVYFSNDEGGLGSKNEFVNSFTTLGGALQFVESFSVTETNFRSLISKNATFEIEGIFLIGYGKALGILAKQIREQGIEVPLFSMAQFGVQDAREAAGDAALGVRYTSPAFSYTDSQVAQHFVGAYQEKYDSPPNFIAAYGYDVARLIAEAAKISETENIDLRSALERIENLEGATGKLTVSPAGEVSSSLVVVQWTEEGEVYQYGLGDPS